MHKAFSCEITGTSTVCCA